jgi:hypothetical protein
VTPLSPANQLAALIRVQVASLRRSNVRPGAAARGQSAQGATEGGPPANLALSVAQGIRAIPADDPQRERRALRLFLESVLLSELGTQIVNDPSFAVMVDQVQAQMEADPQLAEASLRAARILLDAGES